MVFDGIVTDADVSTRDEFDEFLRKRELQPDSVRSDPGGPTLWIAAPPPEWKDVGNVGAIPLWVEGKVWVVGGVLTNAIDRDPDALNALRESQSAKYSAFDVDKNKITTLWVVQESQQSASSSVDEEASPGVQADRLSGDATWPQAPSGWLARYFIERLIRR